MIVTDKFVFIHFFRTGGTFINELLLEHVGGKMLCYHGPSSIIPNEYKHLPIIGIVRNPWDWYVSVYYHCVNYLYLMRTPTALNYILDYEPTSFEDSIKKLLNIKKIIGKSLNYFPDNRDWTTPVCDNLLKTDFLSYLESSKGYCNWYFEHMYSQNDSNVYYCKLENLRNDFLEIMEKIGCKLNDEAYKYLNNRPDTNTTNGGENLFVDIFHNRNLNYHEYYDEELKELVSSKDNEYIKQFDYKF